MDSRTGLPASASAAAAAARFVFFDADLAFAFDLAFGLGVSFCKRAASKLRDTLWTICDVFIMGSWSEKRSQIQTIGHQITGGLHLFHLLLRLALQKVLAADDLAS